MEYRDRIRPTHGQLNQAEGSEGCLECRVVARAFVDGSLVVAYVEIENTATRAASEVLGELICKWWNTGMLYGDCVEWFETMDDAKRDSPFLKDCKPSRSIGRVRTFVDTCVDFGFNDFTHLVVYSGWDRHVSKYPRLVFDDGHNDGWEEVLAESTSLGVIPCESHILDTHKMRVMPARKVILLL